MEQTYSDEAVEFAVSAIETAAAKAGVTGDVVYKAISAEDASEVFCCRAMRRSILRVLITSLMRSFCISGQRMPISPGKYD